MCNSHTNINKSIIFSHRDNKVNIQEVNLLNLNLLNLPHAG